MKRLTLSDVLPTKTEPAKYTVPPHSVMCAWCVTFYDESEAHLGEWDGEAWSCPECVADGMNDPRWLGKILGLIPDDSPPAAKPTAKDDYENTDGAK